LLGNSEKYPGKMAMFGAKMEVTMSSRLSRRRFLEASGLALAGLPLAGAMAGARMDKTSSAQQCDDNGCGYPVKPKTTLGYSYPDRLRKFTPDMWPDLADDEMRITFLGTFGGPPVRRAQQQMSIFVEVGPWTPEPPDPSKGFGKATDSFVFDLGGGCLANYAAMGITYSRMDKVFINHLHADHTADLPNLYCFGPVFDRKWPLYIWGQGRSGVESPEGSGKYYEDGLADFCRHLREAWRWHTEGQSYLPTTYLEYQVPTRDDWHTPVPLTPVGDDAANDSYAIVPIELDWTKTGLDADGDPDYTNIAYQANGVTITHFPVIHYRKGSLGYKLEWNGLSLIYTSDTRPETVSIQQARNGGKGVDVFIHEMSPAQELGVMKTMGLTWPDRSAPGWDQSLDQMNAIVESAHTPQGAFGCLLSRIDPRPQLAVAVHFPVEDDIVECAYSSVRKHFPEGDYPQFGKDIVWPTDLMVLKVKKGKNGKPPKIEQFMGEVSDYTWGPFQNVYGPMADPKYPDPKSQLDTTNLIEAEDDTYCENGY
jgi:ribonuclease Z